MGGGYYGVLNYEMLPPILRRMVMNNKDCYLLCSSKLDIYLLPPSSLRILSTVNSKSNLLAPT